MKLETVRSRLVSPDPMVGVAVLVRLRTGVRSRRFYRSPKVVHSAPGTGIGLHVAHQAVTAHGGAIKVSSNEQSGTTFHIEIPLAGELHEEHATAG